MKIVESKFKTILNELPRLTPHELDIIKQRITNMLQELDSANDRRSSVRGYK